MGGYLSHIRCDRTHGEKESLSHRVTELEHFYQQQNQDPRSDLERKEKELESLSHRVTELEHFYQQQNQDPRMREMEEQLCQARNSCEGAQLLVISNHWQIKAWLSSQLNAGPLTVESVMHTSLFGLSPYGLPCWLCLPSPPRNSSATRFLIPWTFVSDLEEKEKELKSFKDRVAGDVALSMKTGKTFVSLNSPVSRDRLKEMYEELWMEWRKIKNHLKSNGENPESVKEMIQEKFKEAMVAMEKKKKQIDEVFGVNELSRGSASEKVQQYRQSTCQNLQLVLYHGRKEDADLKTPSSPHESEKPQDVMKSWSSKCYWMGCLMALNNPPLHPDWKNHRRSMDPWDFFPRNLTAASGK